MRKIIGLIIAFTLFLLYATDSMYVEWSEIYIIIACLSAVSIVYNLYSEKGHSNEHKLISSAIIGAVFSVVLPLVDLFLDHYRVINGQPDGRFLTLSETISEFSDDLFIIAIVITCTVIFITYAITELYTKHSRKIERY